LLHIDSPGGTVKGLFDTLAAIESHPKPISVHASFACSAAYALAAAAGPIRASNEASEFGSIGVAVSILHFDDVIDITSTEAPNKRPDPTTDEGRAVIRKHLDAIHELFVGAIARGRGTNADRVNKEFGRGAVVLAREAKRRGMIDSIATTATKKVTAAPSGERKTHMNKDELKAQYPDLYAAVLDEGKKAEHERVCAHLNAGKQSGARDLAIECILSGQPMTGDLMNRHIAHALNRRDINARQQDCDSAGAIIDNVTNQTNPGSKDFNDRVADALERHMGVNLLEGTA
jgi:ClpP class serine protease